MSDFLGSGWSFPVELDAQGRIAMARREHDVEQAIKIILMTPKGQRLMRPEFGCQIHELMFAPNDSTTAGLAARYVNDALDFWEPRIRVLNVNAHADSVDPSRLLIDIEYEILATRDRRSLVVPFYTIPEE
jgi:Bacteriophage baseplate protein W